MCMYVCTSVGVHFHGTGMRLRWPQDGAPASDCWGVNAAKGRTELGARVAPLLADWG